MGGCCSTAVPRDEEYLEEPPPRYSYDEARAAVMVATDDALVQPMLERCRGTFPLPGTDKSYCLAHETPTAESRWSSHATLIDPELPSGVAAYRVVFSAGGHVLALHGPAEADEASPASRTNTTDTLGPPLAHALVRPDGLSVELLVGGRSLAVVAGVSCSVVQERDTPFAWLHPDEGCFDSNIKLVPDTAPAEAEEETDAQKPSMVRLRVAEAGGPSEEMPFAYWGDVRVTTECRANAAPRGVVPIGADPLSHARAVQLCGGAHHMAMAAPPVVHKASKRATVKAPHEGLQAVMTVKHRRWGDKELGSLDDHLVLLLTSLAMYNSAVLWRLRTVGLQ